ncbi:MAG: hypothetical protein ACLFQS_07125, partial [Bacteroidales bacterium]
RSLLFVNDCFEGEHNAAIDVFLQTLINKELHTLCSKLACNNKKTNPLLLLSNEYFSEHFHNDDNNILKTIPKVRLIIF